MSACSRNYKFGHGMLAVHALSATARILTMAQHVRAQNYQVRASTIRVRASTIRPNGLCNQSTNHDHARPYDFSTSCTSARDAVSLSKPCWATLWNPSVFDSSPLNVQPTTSTPSGSSTRRRIRYLPRLLVSTSTSPLFTRSISARISVRLSTLSSLNT